MLNETARRPAYRDGIPLNPALKKAHDDKYGANYEGSDPMKSVSTSGGEGPWPVIWAGVFMACVLATIALLFL